MKKSAAATIVLVLGLAFLSGCEILQKVSDREQSFTEGVQTYYLEGGIYEEYKKYVESDPNLREESKAIRTRTAEKLKDLIDTQKGALSN